MWQRLPIEVARAYKYAADKLVEEALSCHEPDLLDYPIFFTYRHVLELYLKIVLDDPVQAKEIGHNLSALIDAVENKFQSKANEWVRARLREFSEVDPTSVAFRYADRLPQHKYVEIWTDFVQLRTVMDTLCTAFEQRIMSGTR